LQLSCATAAGRIFSKAPYTRRVASPLSALHWLGVVALAAAAGALGGGVVVWKATRPAAPLVAAEPGAPTDELTPRVATLEQTVSRLAAQPRVALTLPAPVNSVDAPHAAPAPSAAVVDDPVFEAAVRDVVQRVEEEHASEHEAKLAEQRTTAATHWASGLVEKLHLNEQQQAKVAAIAREFYDHVRDALAVPDGGATPSFNDQRAKVRALRNESEQKLGQVLDPSQLATYEKLDDDDQLSSRTAMRNAR